MTEDPAPHVSVSGSVRPLVAELLARAAALRLRVSAGEAGETLVDCGAGALGSLEAGRLLTEICLGGLGTAAIAPAASLRHPFLLTVRSSQPVLACLASQRAGWHLTHADGAFSAMGSGPARALARTEAIFADLGYCDESDTAVLVLETGTAPPADLVRSVAGRCGVEPARLTILLAPTASLAGSVQIAGRVLEVALGKAHALGFDVWRIREAIGAVPLPPPHPDATTAMGRTNDAVIQGGRVLLHVSGPADEARRLAEALPSRTARDHAMPFAEVFRRAGGDFSRIDPMLFAPAEVHVVALRSGEIFRAGGVDEARLATLLG